ncbi:GerMN domain-containing protein [Paenibacillus sp. UNC451MF]|uniref:GerMN domain-containing protein n=1 Tax=Paenibacillus sp. UNC451MF TaxID=1449063 RepID=UPI00048CCBEA|nr:GerMN domain-containing protein [Paenibacillus sp. UNC451MF]
MQRRLINGAIIGLTLVVLATGCGQAKQAPNASGEPKPGTVAQTPAAGAENKQLKIKVYFGDENGERLVEQESTISYKEDNEKYASALKALTTSPDSKRIALLKGFTFNTVTLKDQTLTVDLSMAPESRLGAGGEDLMLQAMKKTVFQFSEIQNLNILLDGKAVDSLMGHMELPHPIKRG